jgi:signal transduction histidine kinase
VLTTGFTIICLIIVQTASITVLLVHRMKRRRAEAELRASLARIRDMRRQLITAQETERTRIARGLHDDVSQHLALLKLHLDQLAGMVRGPAETIASEITKSADHIATSVRNLSHELYPASLRLIGLVSALDGLVNKLSQRSLRITFTHEAVPANLPPDLALCVFRIVQEALQNALKHSRANTVTVHLSGAHGCLDVTVTDDGRGFVVDAVRHRGIGLINIGERVEAMGGSLNVRSAPRRGTTLTVAIPVPAMETVASAGRRVV